MNTFKQFFESWNDAIASDDWFGYNDDGVNLWSQVKYRDKDVLHNLRSFIESALDVENDPGWGESSDGEWVGFPIHDQEEHGFDATDDLLGFLHNYFYEHHHYRTFVQPGDTHPHWIEIRKNLNYTDKHMRGQTETDFA